MLCDRQFQYTLFLLYICVKTHNVHRNKECSVFHICLFSERYDLLVVAVYQQILSCTEEGFIGLLKRKPNIHVLTRGWVMQFPTLL